MYTIKINEQQECTVEQTADSKFLLDGHEFSPDLLEVKPGIFHLILNHRSYLAEVISNNAAEKTFQIRINGNTYRLKAQDRFDALLHELGMDNLSSRKADDLKAPMPGLVVEVAVTEGMEVKQGDKLVVLEAMKMENILKAPADAVIRKVNVSKGKTVEKNEVMVVFES